MCFALTPSLLHGVTLVHTCFVLDYSVSHVLCVLISLSTDDKESLLAALRAPQACRYLIYSEADFEVFRPAGATRCTDGVKFGTEEGTEVPLLRAKFHPHRCNNKGVGPPKLKFLLRFDRNVEYKRPEGAYPLRDFHKICRVCT